ncbi:unnamed protein product, partial [Mesorhabditis belari]|uniref:non-specific serine/threonine protein kinase n=1 Tax=Mesorhabditis belari TaxID=2138241 RepID=A0AAF3J9P2_9BILA
MTTSDQFELGKCIGQGTYGAVYELIGHEPPAVMKYMPCGNAEQLKIFKNECEALIKIHHGNIVRLYRHVEEKDRVGIVMEYCQKGPLKGVLLDPNITYSMNTVLTWGIQLFDAIDHMYQKHKLVHRDIKPDNIFLTNEYQLKIGDFGLVKAVGDETVAGTCMGTPRYMSPPDMKDDGVRNVYEQMRDIKDSHRNDVYSLGLVMWEIMERRTIFTNYERSGMFDRDQLLFDIALKRLTEIEPPECQSEIQKIISRCTNFQRIHRPAASEVLDFLNQTQKGIATFASLISLPTAQATNRSSTSQKRKAIIEKSIDNFGDDGEKTFLGNGGFGAVYLLKNHKPYDF